MASVNGKDEAWSALMRQAQAGDSAAYATLLRELVPFLRVLARRLRVPPQNAEDVVQDVLLTLHRVRQTYDPDLPFLPWLAAIAKRRAIDVGRKLGRVAAWEISAPDTLETFVAPTANDSPEARDMHRWLRRAVAELPAKQREALELVKFQELSVAEAATRSGQSQGAIKVNTHRAIRALTKIFGHD